MWYVLLPATAAAWALPDVIVKSWPRHVIGSDAGSSFDDVVKVRQRSSFKQPDAHLTLLGTSTRKRMLSLNTRPSRAVCRAPTPRDSVMTSPKVKVAADKVSRRPSTTNIVVL